MNAFFSSPFKYRSFYLLYYSTKNGQVNLILFAAMGFQPFMSKEKQIILRRFRPISANEEVFNPSPDYCLSNPGTTYTQLNYILFLFTNTVKIPIKPPKRTQLSSNIKPQG